MKFSRLLVGALLSMAFLTIPARADNIVITLDALFSSADPNAPGTWELFGRIDDTGSGADGSLGLSAIRALLTEIDFGTDGDAITIMPGIGAISLPGGRIPALQFLDGTVDLFYGQEISATGEIVPNVGNSGDALIAFGSFSAGQSPGFGQDGSGLTSQGLFLTSVVPGGGNAIDPDQNILVVFHRVVPEPTSLLLCLVAGLALTSCRRARYWLK